FVNMLLPLGAALLVLAVALAAYVMVKFFGLAFLGRPREAQRSPLHDADGWQRAGLTWLAAGCVLLGVLPTEVIPRLQAVTSQLHLGAPASGGTWWSLVPEGTRQASYSPLLFLGAIGFAVLATFLAVRLFYHGRARRSGVWTCGFGALDPRAQESAEGFGQPLRRIFEPFFAIERELPEASDPAPRYRLSVADRC